MTIIHDVYGEVEGARRCYAGEKGTWEKNGAIYLGSNGWREKVEERWEPRIVGITVGETFTVSDGWPITSQERVRCVEREGKPCLIIERKVGKDDRP